MSSLAYQKLRSQFLIFINKSLKQLSPRRLLTRWLNKIRMAFIPKRLASLDFPWCRAKNTHVVLLRYMKRCWSNRLTFAYFPRSNCIVHLIYCGSVEGIVEKKQWPFFACYRTLCELFNCSISMFFFPLSYCCHISYVVTTNDSNKVLQTLMKRRS